MTRNFLLLLVGASLMANSVNAITVEPGKQLPQSVNVNADGGESDVTVRFLLFTPADYKDDGEPWPLLLFLHGYGECSDTDLDRVKIHGPAKIVDSRPDFPFVVVTPQCPALPREMQLIRQAWKPGQLIQLVDHIIDELNIDRERIYVTGLSMGGFGTWRLAAAYPERFAAAAPVCGGGEPHAMAVPLASVPIWAFHGAQDTVVPPELSEEMVDAVREAGGDVRLTIYPDVGHNSWDNAYNDEKLYKWLLSHRTRGEKRETRNK